MVDTFSIRGYGPSVPLVSPELHDVIKVTLDTVDFSNASAVREAHRKIADLGWVDWFCDLVFHGRHKAKSLHALATLILYHHAESREPPQSTEHIAQTRQEAIATLAERLSPTGLKLLLDTLAVGSSEFTRFLTVADRYALAAQACRTCRTRVYPAGRVAELFTEAAHYYTQARQPARAGDAEWSAGLVLWKEPELRAEAAEVFGRAADAYTLAGQHGRAGRASERGAIANMALAHHHEQAGNADSAGKLHKAAAEAFERAGASHMQGGRYALAAPLYVRAERAYASARLPLDKFHEHSTAAWKNAGDAFKKAAEAVALSSHGERATLAVKAVEAFERAGGGAALADTGLMAAQALSKVAGFQKAARVAVQAAGIYAQLGRHRLAGDAYLQAARAYMGVFPSTGAAGAYRDAADAYTRAGLPEAATSAYRQAYRLDPTVKPAPNDGMRASIREVLTAIVRRGPLEDGVAVIGQFGHDGRPHGPWQLKMDLPNGDFLSNTPFDSPAVLEWCLVHREKGMYDLVPEAELSKWLTRNGNRHFYEHRPLDLATEVVRGSRLLAALQSALRVLAGNAPAQHAPTQQKEPLEIGAPGGGSVRP